MATKKRTSYRRKIVSPKGGPPLRLTITQKTFPRAIYIKESYSDAQIERILKNKIRPEFEKFFKRQQKLKNGDKYIFTMRTGLNFSGRRVKHGFSNRRVKLKSLKHFDRAMHDLLHQAKTGLLSKLQKYLSRRGITSFSIKGVKMEVANATKSRASKGPKRGKKKTVRGH